MRTPNIDPLFVFGPPRSGTTLVARVLCRMGMAYGFQINTRFESWICTQLNQFMFRKRGASWHRPTKNRNQINTDFYDIHRLREHIIEQNIEKMDIPFFWKCPCWGDFNAPVWNEVFEKPRFLRVIRHPADVAISLTKHQRDIPDKELKKPEPKNSFPGQLDRWPSKSRRCLDPHDTIELVAEIYNHEPAVDYETIRYEPLANKVDTKYQELAEFIGVHTTHQRRNKIKEMAYSGSVYDYRSTTKGKELWKQNKHLFDNVPYD